MNMKEQQQPKLKDSIFLVESKKTI